jgi:hypothetical protein
MGFCQAPWVPIHSGTHGLWVPVGLSRAYPSPLLTQISDRDTTRPRGSPEL